MDLKDEIFICSDCGWKERRKIAGHPTAGPEGGESRGPYRPREGFRPREGGRFGRPRRPFRPREG